MMTTANHNPALLALLLTAAASSAVNVKAASKAALDAAKRSLFAGNES